MEVERSTITPNNARFSRYRSVRKTISQEDHKIVLPAVPTIPVTAQESHAPVSRAPSRYRRPTAPRTVEAPVPELVTINAKKVPSRYQRKTPAPERPVSPEAIIEEQDVQTTPLKERVPIVVRTPPQTTRETQTYEVIPVTQNRDRRTTRYRSRTVTSPQERQSIRRSSYDAAREQARLILEGEYDRIQKLKIQQEKAEKERKMRAEAKLAAQRKAEQVVDLEARSQATARAKEEEQPKRSRKWTIGGSSGNTSTPTSAPQSPPMQELQPMRESHNQGSSPDAQHLERTTTRNRRRKEDGSASEEASRRRGTRTAHSRPREAPAQRAWEPKVGDGPPKTAVNGPQTITDAPISAVNAGERRVEVRYEKSKITLPVTPTTTAKDLLNSASVIMSQPIDPRTAVLVETYYPLGLERALRRYEHIRDVMNSWDSDTQNYLMILPQSECAAAGLEQKDAPVMQPSPTIVNILHSQRPGKWDKHWMILKADGQVTASTKENDGNANSVFHLSDFDVYMPTKKELKKLRAPKKICFAIKSQQRSIMFESTENFVHFFSTSDKIVADQWYNAVQAWRSWYLVNILEAGTGPKPADAAAAVAAAVIAAAEPKRPSTSHSRDSVPYQLGTFQPFLDFSADAFKYGEDEASKSYVESNPVTSPKRSKDLIDRPRSKSITDTKVTGLERHATKKKSKPPAMSTRPETIVVMPTPPPSSTDAAFTGTGLLARAFSVRKAQAEENAAFMENTENAFTGKGLLSKKQSTKRFVRENPNPGVIENASAAFTGMGLISRKTSVKKTLPTQEDLFPGVVQNTNDAFTGAGLISRKISVKKPTSEDLFPGHIQNTNDAFTGGGMLSIQRASTKKRSAASARPGQPLLDMTGSSEFADRSLLRQVEQYEIEIGANMPLIDRSRGIEVKEKTGEV